MMQVESPRQKDKNGYLIIPLEFIDKKWHFKQLFRKNDVAVYVKNKGTGSSYEAIIIQKHDGYTVFKKTFPPAEFYPRSEDWGCKGFSYTNEKEALDKAKKLLIKDK